MINPFSVLTSKIFAGVAIAALTFGAVQTVRLEGFMFIKGYIEKLADEQKAHKETKERYSAAQAEAQIINKIEVERIEREYAAVGEQAERKYNALLADNRAAVARFVRHQATKRSAKGSGASSIAEMPTGVVQSTEEATVLVSDLEIAADNYSQLVALIEWAKGVGAVETATDAVQE